MNFEKFPRTPFLQNTAGQLLLKWNKTKCLLLLIAYSPLTDINTTFKIGITIASNFTLLYVIVIGLYRDVNLTRNRCHHNIGCPLGKKQTFRTNFEVHTKFTFQDFKYGATWILSSVHYPSRSLILQLFALLHIVVVKNTYANGITLSQHSNILQFFTSQLFWYCRHHGCWWLCSFTCFVGFCSFITISLIENIFYLSCYNRKKKRQPPP